MDVGPGVCRRQWGLRASATEYHRFGPKYLRKITGLTTQENSFYEKLTIMENMKYYANLYNVNKKNLREHLENILDSVDLLKNKNTRAERLSGGMKRRLDFALSIIHDPELLILDEPTTGLNPILVEQFWNVINKAKEKKTIIVISHIFSELKNNCNRLCILNQGKVKIINITKGTDLHKEFLQVVKPLKY